jgi:hypothetical protein
MSAQRRVGEHGGDEDDSGSGVSDVTSITYIHQCQKSQSSNPGSRRGRQIFIP